MKIGLPTTKFKVGEKEVEIVWKDVLGMVIWFTVVVLAYNYGNVSSIYYHQVFAQCTGYMNENGTIMNPYLPSSNNIGYPDLTHSNETHVGSLLR